MCSDVLISAVEREKVRKEMNERIKKELKQKYEGVR